METELSSQILGVIVDYLTTQLSLTITEGGRSEAFGIMKSCAKKTYNVVRSSIEDDKKATQVLDKLESDPQNNALQASLEIYIKELIKTNNDFKQTVEEILDEIKRNSKGDSFYFISGDQINYVNAKPEEKESCVPFTSMTKKEVEKHFSYELLKGYYTAEDILDKSTMEVKKVLLPFYLIDGVYTTTFEYTKNNGLTREVKTIPIGSRSFNEIVTATNISKCLALHENHDTKELLIFLEEKITIFDDNLKTLNSFDSKDIIKSTFDIKRDKAENTIKDRLSLELMKEMKRELDLDSEDRPLLYPLNIQWGKFKRIYLPFWVLIYYYNNKEYISFMKGYDDKFTKGCNNKQLYEEKKPQDDDRLIEDVIDVLKYVSPPFALILFVCFGTYFFINEKLIVENLNSIIVVSLILLLFFSSIPFKHIIQRMNISTAIKNDKYENYCAGNLHLKERNNKK